MDLTVICQGCLSQDRALSPLEQLDNIFNIIFNQHLDTFKMVSTTSDILLCWECVQMLRNIERYHHKVLIAQRTLQEMIEQNSCADYIEPLSSLASTQIDVTTIPTPDMEIEITLKCLKEVTISKVSDVELRRSPRKHVDETQNILKETAFDVNILENLKEESDLDDIYDDNGPEDSNEVIKEEKKIIPTPPKKKTITRRKRTTTEKQKITSFKTSVKTKVINKKKRVKKPNHPELKMSTKIAFFKLNKYLLTVVPGPLYDIAMTKNLTCTKCNEVCYNETDFTSHMKLHFQKYMCRFCSDDYIYDEDNIIRHVRKEHRHDMNLRTCRKCSKRFVCDEELETHKKECGVYKCNDCDAVYTCKTLIVAHCKRLHMKFDCKECNITFKTYENYKQHKQRCHSNNDPESAYCVECDVQYKSVMSLQEHLKTSVKHLPESKVKRYQCSKCPNVYRKNINLKNHYNKAHIGITKYHCDTCQKYFLTGTLLRKHDMSKHLNIPRAKPHSCTYCEKSFSDSAALRNHITLHTGEKPYRCVYCDMRFNKGGWYYHMSIAHPNSVRDVNSARVRDPVATHYNADCHPDEVKPVNKHICLICGKAYKLKRYLRYHNYTHTGEKPNVCKLCGRTFRFHGNYYKHLRNEHHIYGDKKEQRKEGVQDVSVT